MRDSIAAGTCPDRRLQVSIVLISQTGGHGDGFLAGPGFEMSSGYLMPDWPGKPPYLVDGVESMRHAVRAVLRVRRRLRQARDHGRARLRPRPRRSSRSSRARRSRRPSSRPRRKGKARRRPRLRGRGSRQRRPRQASARSSTAASSPRSRRRGWRRRAAGSCRPCRRCATRSRGREAGQADPAPVPEDPRLRARARRRGQAGEGVRRADGDRHRLHHARAARRNLEELLLMRAGGPDRRGDAAGGDGRRRRAAAASTSVYGRIAPGYVFDAIVLDDDPGDLSVFASPGRGHRRLPGGRGRPSRTSGSRRRPVAAAMTAATAARPAVDRTSPCAGSTSTSAASTRCAESTSRSRAARSTASSARTAPASRRSARSSRASHRPDDGELLVDGRRRRLPLAARRPRRRGRRSIAQEPTLVPHRSVLENVFLGVETHARAASLDERAMRAPVRRARRARRGFELPPRPARADAERRRPAEGRDPARDRPRARA